MSAPGVVLADHAAGFVIGPREREYSASNPTLDGFDVCAFMLRTPADMATVVDRCAVLGIVHGGVHDRGDFGIAMDIPTRTDSAAMRGRPAHWASRRVGGGRVRSRTADPL